MSCCNNKCVNTSTFRQEGEVNSGQNLGSGEGVFFKKSGVNLQFKSLKAGSGINLSSTSDEITINSNDISGNFIHNQFSQSQSAAAWINGTFRIQKNITNNSDYSLNLDSISVPSGLNFNLYSIFSSHVLNSNNNVNLLSGITSNTRTALTSQSNIDVLTSLSADVEHNGSGTINSVYGLRTNASVNGTGTVIDLIGIKINSNTLTSGSATKNYGLFIANQLIPSSTHSTALHLFASGIGGRISWGNNGNNPTVYISQTGSLELTVSHNLIASTSFKSPTIIATKDSATGEGIILSTSLGVNRWGILGNLTETGSSNTGYDFSLRAFSDAGSVISNGTWFQIKRADGSTIIRNNLTIGRFAYSPSNIALDVYSRNDASGFPFRVRNNIDTSTLCQIDFDGKFSIGGTSGLNLKLNVNGTDSAPSTSGSLENGSIRAIGGNNAGTVLDVGVNPSNQYSWIQSRSSSDHSINRLLNINPNGGGVNIGYTSSASAPTVTDIPNGSYRMWDNTTTGESRLYLNKGGVLKSVLLT